jgi:hypothetical protein
MQGGKKYTIESDILKGRDRTRSMRQTWDTCMQTHTCACKCTALDSYLGQNSGVFQPIQGLFYCEIEGHVLGEDVKILVFDCRCCHWGVWTCKYFLCELLLSIPFRSHLEWDSVVYPIMQVQTLEVSSLMQHLVPWVTITFLPTEPRWSWVTSGRIIDSATF